MDSLENRFPVDKNKFLLAEINFSLFPIDKIMASTNRKNILNKIILFLVAGTNSCIKNGFPPNSAADSVTADSVTVCATRKKAFD